MAEQSADDPFTRERLAVPPTQKITPQKIVKRRQQFVKLPVVWIERLKGASGHTHDLANWLLHRHWKHYGRPFTLANGVLEYDGISRQSKWRGLAELESRGLIEIERRSRKSPVIRLNLL